MDEKKDICGETKTTGETTWICARKPHTDLNRQRRFNRRDGVFFFNEPPANSHRMINIKKL